MYPNKAMELQIFATQSPMASIMVNGLDIFLEGEIDVYVLDPEPIEVVALSLYVFLEMSEILYGIDIAPHLKPNHNVSVIEKWSTVGNVSTVVCANYVLDFLEAVDGRVEGKNMTFPILSIPGLEFPQTEIQWSSNFAWIFCDIRYTPTHKDSVNIL